MKEISVTAVDQVNPADKCVVSPEMYYGIRSPFQRKGFIVREQFQAGYFKTQCPGLLTNGNDWTHRNESLADLLNDLRGSKFAVFEFDTYQELFKWLSES